MHTSSGSAVARIYSSLMTFAYPLSYRRRRTLAIALTIGVHLLLFWGWKTSMHAPGPDASDAVERIQWLLVPPQAKAPVANADKPKAAPAPSRPRTPASPQRPSVIVPDAEPALSIAEQQAEVPAAAVMPSLAERARASAGAIDRALRKANPRRLITAPVITAQMRFQNGIQAANDAAPNRWFEAPKVTEIIDPGGYGRRRYKVVGANGTYCITIESNHAPDGIDSMQHGIKPKLTNCPPDEQAATKQDWDKDL